MGNVPTMVCRLALKQNNCCFLIYKAWKLISRYFQFKIWFFFLFMIKQYSIIQTRVLER